MPFRCSTSSAFSAGKAGALLLPLLGELRMPIVTTLHTILARPDAEQRRVMDEIIRRSERLVVMSAHAPRCCTMCTASMRPRWT